MEILYISAALILVFGLMAIYTFIEFKQKEKNFPDACELEGLSTKLAVVKDDLESTVEARDEAFATIEEGKRAQSAIKFYEDHREEFIKKDAELAKLESIRGEYETIFDKMTTATEELKVKQIELLPLENKHKELKELNQEFEDRNKKLREEERELDLAVHSQEKMRSDNLLDIQKTNKELSELKDKLAKISIEFEEKKALLAVFETKKETLQKEMEILDQSLKNARDMADKHGGIHDEEETLKDLWDPISYPKLVPSHKQRGEDESLAYTSRFIRGKKLHFPERTFHAFHTAMKCNDISPITVLAGISGTGKSELPKRYAEGMGMHFSMLAVQPRWDSPQDLLGFYNYMEHRYKATELARALVRFDAYNRRNWKFINPKCDDRSDRMLMVLLDEMNLARVEYYFSEFLSKLETRRGVDVNNAMDRIKAEIELEIGTGISAMHLYPGRNILFTGTMNEDESTQALSDKVLDRASVLRFGKPHKTNMVIDDPEIDQRDDGLLHADWQNWVTDFKKVRSDSDVDKWIQELNDAMNLLKKPFGHRVAQAMASYVQNYPNWVHDGKRKAFADQIEQRILPKLRGIDLQEGEAALNRISRLIDTTNDEILGHAFKLGMEDNMHGIFMWHGIDRSQEK